MLNVLLVALGLTLNTAAPNSIYKTIAEESSVVWTATKVVGGGHTGTVNIIEGKMEITDSQLKGGSFTIDMTSIANTDVEGTWREKLEGHLKSEDFFAVETYNTAQLVITKVKNLNEGRYEVTGDLTIKGKTAPITFPAELSLINGQAVATANIIVDRSTYDVRYGSSSFFDDLGDKAISDEFTLDVKLVSSK